MPILGRYHYSSHNTGPILISLILVPTSAQCHSLSILKIPTDAITRYDDFSVTQDKPKITGAGRYYFFGRWEVQSGKISLERTVSWQLRWVLLYTVRYLSIDRVALALRSVPLMKLKFADGRPQLLKSFRMIGGYRYLGRYGAIMTTPLSFP